MAWRSLELFVGAGGLALGAAQAGFEHVAVVDWDASACATLRANQRRGVQYVRDWHIIEVDVRGHDFSQYATVVDALFAGPPCQPFSIGGKHAGQGDERNMFPEAIRAVREIRPKAFLIENVSGLQRPGFADYYDYILCQLRLPDLVERPGEAWQEHHRRLKRHIEALGPAATTYCVSAEAFDAAALGVPQRRQRVFMVGILSGLGTQYRFPENDHTRDALLHDQWVTGEYWARHGVPSSERGTPSARDEARVRRLWQEDRSRLGGAWRTVRDAIEDLPRIPVGVECATIPNHFINPGARSYVGHDGSDWDMPAKTLKAGRHGVAGGENTLRIGGDKVRYFSVRECARLQTFPDEWVFEGAWTATMRQLGNAVPVELARRVCARVAEALPPQ